MKSRDGSILSSYFNFKEASNGEAVFDNGSQLMLGQIEKVYFTDDPANRSKQYVEYDVSVRDAKGGQSVFKSVRKMELLGGINDFSEQILEANEFAFEGKLDPSNLFKNKNGTIVVLAFLNASIDKPLIIGSLSHPKKVGAVKADGIRNIAEFRGMTFEIDKDGALKLTYNSNKTPDTKTTRKETGPTQISIDNKGRFKIIDNENQSLLFDRVAKKVTLEQLDGTTLINQMEFDKPAKKITRKAGTAKIVEVMDGTAEKTTLTFQSGLVITCDGAGDKVTIQTAGGVKLDIDGPADKVLAQTTGGAKVLVDGSSGTIEAKDNGTGKLKITGDKVALGASSAELLQQLSDALDAIKTAATAESSHTHIGNLGYPTAPPTTAGDWSSLASALGAIKGLVDGIKGSL
jgi:hypothetical protein